MSPSEEIELVYDRFGRLAYHPEYHPNHGKPFSEEDLEYLCKFYEVDGPKNIGAALGRTEATVANTYRRLKKSGRWNYYRNLGRYW